MKAGIYQIKGPNGKVYIGQSQSIPKRWCSHRGALVRGHHFNQHLQAAWNKYGAEAFTFEPLMYFEVEDLNAAEQIAIDSLSADHKYNKAIFADAPARGLKATPEQRLQMSLSRQGRKNSPEHIEKTRQGHIGSKRSLETRVLMSKIQKGNKKCVGRVLSEATKAKIAHAHLGMKVSPEVRLKMSETRKGRPGKSHCAATKEKLRLSRIGKKASEETRLKMSEAQRRRYVNG